MSGFTKLFSILLLFCPLLFQYWIFVAAIRSTEKTPLFRTRAWSSKTRITLRGGADLVDVTAHDDETNEQKHKPTSENFIPRYVGPSVDEMTPEQRDIRDAIIESRPRTGLSGPFGPWLAVPDIARPAQDLGRVCRYKTSLSFRESELVILLTGAKTKSHAEFDIHVGEAIKAGMSMEVISSIPRDDEFSQQAVKEQLLPLLNEKNYSAREKAIVTFASELLETSSVSDETYNMAKAVLDGQDSALVEITSIVGYYTYVAYTLNVFKIPSNSEQ